MPENKFWEIVGIEQQRKPGTYLITLKDSLSWEFYEVIVPVRTVALLMQHFAVRSIFDLVQCIFWAPGRYQPRWALTYFLGEDTPFEAPLVSC